MFKNILIVCLLLNIIIVTHCLDFTKNKQFNNNNNNNNLNKETIKGDINLNSNFYLFSGGEVYSPNKLGKTDIIFGGQQILSLLSQQSNDPIKNSKVIEVVNITGLFVIPGLIDVHVHVTGGGGELGPYSRTPEAQLSQLIEGGITTLVGILGTDSISRSLDNLITKVRSLQTGGLTAYMWSGAYRYPPPTFTGDVMRDLVIVDEVIGVGEVAISDHRSSCPSVHELSRLVSDARVSGLISGKAGIVHFHVGSASTGLDPLWEVLEKTSIPITQMYPTHVSSRGPLLLEQGKQWIQQGGFVDFTADADNETDTLNALINYLQSNVNMSRVSISSDAYGSLPLFDDQGILIGYGVASPAAVFQTIKNLVLKGWPLEQALPLATTNPASFLAFSKKGQIKVGNDADFIVVNENLEIQYVVANGKILKTPTWVAKGMFPCT
eukprot:TRINITY_DN2014_c5_g1_i1.p1 TRINITY_DN2014_c5_g1~~TRINITY_DN2014_c5_g1_i1.p1  ORF type:complete len:438 (-),score=201.07 TRINITY_DN2014_c5_g1_i1:200-1513(-)